MGAAMQIATTRTKAENLRYYLGEWCRWQRAWRPGIGAPGAVPWADAIKPSPAGQFVDDYCVDEAESWQVRAVDAAVRELEESDWNKAKALRIRWMGEEAPGTWKAHPNYVRDLADRAEADLIPLVEQRNLLL